MRLRSCAILLLGLTLVQAQAMPVTLAEVPFQFREGLIWIEAKVPQSAKPLNFLLDTGAGVSVVNLATAKKLGLTLGREVTVRGVQATLTGYWQERMRAEAGNVTLPGRYLAVDLQKLSAACQQPVDGLVGMDFFRGRVVQIDFEAQMIRVMKPEKRSATDNVLPLRMRPCGMLVPAGVNGQNPQWFRLDTGCATALHWVTSNVSLDDCTRQLAIGLAEISIPQTQTAVILGEHEFEHVPTGLHGAAIFPGEAGLLGNGLLSRFSSITIDGKAGRLIFGKRREVLL